MSNTLTLERDAKVAGADWHFIDKSSDDESADVIEDDVAESHEPKSLSSEWQFKDRLVELICELDESDQLDEAASIVARAWAQRGLDRWGDGLEEALAAGAAEYADEDSEIAEQTLRLSSEDLTDE